MEFRNVVRIARENPSMDAEDIIRTIHEGYQTKSKLHTMVANFGSLFTNKPLIMRPSTFEILHKCCEIYGADIEFIRSKSRKREIIRIRQQYCLIARLFKYSLRSTGEEIGKDHATVIWNKNNALKFYESEPYYRDEVDIIIDEFPNYKTMLMDRLTNIIPK